MHSWGAADLQMTKQRLRDGKGMAGGGGERSSGCCCPLIPSHLFISSVIPNSKPQALVLPQDALHCILHPAHAEMTGPLKDLLKKAMSMMYSTLGTA